MKKWRMCEVFVTTLVAGWLYSGCLAQAQNPQCPTRPFGDNTNACASTAFVQAAIAPLPQGFANPTGVVGLSAVNGVLTTALRSDAAPPLSQAIAPTWTGVHTFSANPMVTFVGTGGGSGQFNFRNTSQNQLYVEGVGNSRTMAIQINPGSGTLATDTITEYILSRTNAQAFGGDYGRWSFTQTGSSLNFATGFYGEYGGTVAPGPFLFQIGIENPPSTFTVYEYIRFQTTDGGSEDAQAGSISFGVNQPLPGTQQNRIVLIKPSIGSAGQRDSDAILWEAKANNGTERAVWWRQWVDVTSNAGASQFTWQQNLNGGGYNTIMTLGDNSLLTINGQPGSAPPTAIAGTVPQFVGANGVALRILGDAANNGVSTAGVVYTGRTSRGTIASPSPLQSGDLIVSLSGRGYGTTAFSSTGRGGMVLNTTQIWTDANQGTQFVVQTTPNGSTTVRNVGTFDQDGSLTLNVGGAGFALSGSGSGTWTQKAAATASGTVTWPAGTTDFSATGGASQVVKQTSSGGAFTVARLACADLSDAAATCSSASGESLVVGTTVITSGTTTRILYDNAGVLGEYTLTGSGTVVAMQTAPTFITSITDPLVIGGTGTGSTLEARTTSGVGATDVFKVTMGNNGGTQVLTVRNSDATCGFVGCFVFGSGTTNPGYLTTFAPPAGQHSILQIVNSTTGYANGNGTFFGVLTGAKEFRFDQQENDNILFITNGNGASGGFAGAGRIWSSAGWSLGASCVGTDPGTNNVLVCGNAVMATAAKTLVLKQGANGTVGTFICTGGGTITISNTNFAITDTVIFSMNTAGGTITTPPAMKTVTGATGFTVLCGATDTSTYNYGIIKNAAWLLDPANDNWPMFLAAIA